MDLHNEESAESTFRDSFESTGRHITHGDKTTRSSQGSVDITKKNKFLLSQQFSNDDVFLENKPQTMSTHHKDGIIKPLKDESVRQATPSTDTLSRRSTKTPETEASFKSMDITFDAGVQKLAARGPAWISSVLSNKVLIPYAENTAPDACCRIIQRYNGALSADMKRKLATSVKV